MKKYINIALILLLGPLSLLFGESFGKKSNKKQLRVVASIPDLAWMAKRIGGDNVTVISLSTGKEDLHAVPVKPSFLPKLYRADLLITLGLDAEHAWLPALTRESRNSKIMPGQPNWINCSEGIDPLDVPKSITRLEGEQHPLGNPHINLSPQNGIVLSSNIFSALNRNLPEQASTNLKQNLFSLQVEISNCISNCRKKGSRFVGEKIDFLSCGYGLSL